MEAGWLMILPPDAMALPARASWPRPLASGTRNALPRLTYQDLERMESDGEPSGAGTGLPSSSGARWRG